MLEGARLFLGEDHHLPRALREPFEHRDSPSCSPDPEDAKTAPAVYDGRWKLRDNEGATADRRLGQDSTTPPLAPFIGDRQGRLKDRGSQAGCRPPIGRRGTPRLNG